MQGTDWMRRVIEGLALGGLLFAAGCAKPPIQEMADAENAVNAAIQAGAEEYSPDDLTAAQDALADANAKVESKDYKGAKAAAMDAKVRAETAAATVEANRQSAKTEAEQRMTAVKPEIEALQAAATKLKGPDAEKIRADAAALKDQWDAIQKDYDSGHYRTAIDDIADTQARLDEVKAELETAKAQAPAPGRKKSR